MARTRASRRAAAQKYWALRDLWNRETTMATRWSIVAQKQLGWPTARVARNHSVAWRTANHWWTVFQKTGNFSVFFWLAFPRILAENRIKLLSDCVCSTARSSSGRPSKTTPSSRNTIARRLVTGKTSVYGAARLHNPPISPSTVREICKRKGLRYLSCVPTAVLTPVHRRKRRLFAKFHLAQKTDFKKVHSLPYQLSRFLSKNAYCCSALHLPSLAHPPSILFR